MNNEPVAWMQTWENQDGELKHTVNIEQIGKNDIPLYTHPAKELNDGGEPVKNATYWKRQHDGLLMKLNASAIKIAELEKDLALKTRDRDVFRNFTLAYEERIAELEKELEIKELVIDRLIDSFDNARACLNVDVEELERLYR